MEHYFPGLPPSVLCLYPQSGLNDYPRKYQTRQNNSKEDHTAEDQETNAYQGFGGERRRGKLRSKKIEGKGED